VIFKKKKEKEVVRNKTFPSPQLHQQETLLFVEILTLLIGKQSELQPKPLVLIHAGIDLLDPDFSLPIKRSH